MTTIKRVKVKQLEISDLYWLLLKAQEKEVVLKLRCRETTNWACGFLFCVLQNSLYINRARTGLGGRFLFSENWDCSQEIKRCLCYTSREGDGTPLQYSCLENPMDGGAWWAAVHGVAKSRTRLSDFTFTFHFHALEKEMAIHSSVLAWRIPGTGEPDGLPSLGSHRVGHYWSDLAAAAVAAWFLLPGAGV